MCSVHTVANLALLFISIFPESCVDATSLERRSRGKRDLWTDLLEIIAPQNKDPDIDRNATELITSKGFPCENHYVTTDDGYIINVVRIPHGRNNSNIGGPRPVAIVHHGFLTSCTVFLENPVDQGLAYVLADAGVDVWLPNTRGTRYSLNHTSLSPDNPEFWNYAYDEMGKYDVPAVVELVTSVTGQDQVYYIGYSQGTTTAMIAFGNNKTTESHIKHFFALAPVAQNWHTKSPLRVITPLACSVQPFFNLVNHGEFSISPEVMTQLAKSVCIPDTLSVELCSNVFFLFTGFDPKNINMSRVPVYIAHNPESVSARNVAQWMQAVNSKQFQKFDYCSPEENMKYYNQTTPPLYDPKNVKVQVTIFRGGNDIISTPEDNAWLLPQLNVTKDVYIENYTHVDFSYATDARELVYKPILAEIFP